MVKDINIPAADYSFVGTTYSNTIFEKFQLVPDQNGKVFYWTAEGYVMARFVCFLGELI